MPFGSGVAVVMTDGCNGREHISGSDGLLNATTPPCHRATVSLATTVSVMNSGEHFCSYDLQRHGSS